MASRFRLQILDTHTGDVVQWAPGSALETDFVDDCTARILAHGFRPLSQPFGSLVSGAVDAITKRGVGLGRTTKHVAQDIRDGLNETLIEGGLSQELEQVRARVETSVAVGIAEAVQALKAKVRP